MKKLAAWFTYKISGPASQTRLYTRPITDVRMTPRVKSEAVLE